MFFSLQPKHNRENLYDREEELKALERSISDERMIILSGIRRIGKTSLLKVFLNEQRNPYVFLDCRNLIKNNRIDRENFNRAFLEGIKNALEKDKLGKILELISSIKISGFEITLRNRKDTSATLSDLLLNVDRALEKKGRKIILALDEAQNLRFYGRGGGDLLNLLAFSYDHLSNVVFILTGSEVGLLHDFLKLDDPERPLFGRYVEEIALQRFTREKSVDFLYKGFEQAGIEPKGDEIEEVVRELDGIVGYLSIYGYIVYTHKDWHLSFEKTTEMASRLVESEVKELVRRSRNYGYVMKAVAFGMETYSTIKKYIESNFGGITDQTLSNNLSSLIKQGFLEYHYKESKKIYDIPDPVVKKVCTHLRLNPL